MNESHRVQPMAAKPHESMGSTSGSGSHAPGDRAGSQDRVVNVYENPKQGGLSKNAWIAIGVAIAILLLLLLFLI